MENQPAGSLVTEVTVSAKSKFTCTSSNNNFKLNQKPPSNPLLHQLKFQVLTANKFDREILPEIELDISCQTTVGGGTHRAVKKMKISIKDQNDNFPNILLKPMSGKSRKFVNFGIQLASIKATDDDVGLNGQVSCTTSTKDFALEREERGDYALIMGQIYKNKLTTAINKMEQFVAKIECKDYGVPSLTSVLEVKGFISSLPDNKISIHINNADYQDTETPKLDLVALTPSGKFEISENMPSRSVLGHVTTGIGNNGNVKNITCFTNTEVFQLEKRTETVYILVTTESLDYEQQHNYDIAIQCIDTTRPYSIIVQYVNISVIDLNDQSPQFTRNVYAISVRENNQVGSTLIQVTATDLDTGFNGEVHYRIAGKSQNLVAIDKDSGLITAIVSFDREAMDKIEYTVIAMDKGAPPLFSTAEIVLKIEEINDVKPEFTSSVYHFSVLENKPVGTPVGEVHAIDRDLHGMLYNISYYIDHGNATDELFSIDINEGIIKSKTRLDREMEAEHRVKVIAHGNEDWERGYADVIIHVMDDNDHSPCWKSPSDDVINISHNAMPGDVITQVSAEDGDLGLNAQLKYYIIGANNNRANMESGASDLSHLFSIDEETGKVMVKESLKEHCEKVVNLRLGVSDKGTPSLSNIMELNFSISC